jgi:hypothetical protein
VSSQRSTCLTARWASWTEDAHSSPPTRPTFRVTPENRLAVRARSQRVRIVEWVSLHEVRVRRAAGRADGYDRGASGLSSVGRSSESFRLSHCRVFLNGIDVGHEASQTMGPRENLSQADLSARLRASGLTVMEQNDRDDYYS